MLYHLFFFFFLCSTLLAILSSPIGLGFTVATSTLTFAEFLALSGIQWTHNAVEAGLIAAKETIGVLDKFFGSNDTGLFEITFFKRHLAFGS